MIFISSLSFETRREINPKRSRKIIRINITLYRHKVGSGQFCLDAIGKRSSIISRNGFFGLFFYMKFFRRMHRTNAHVTATTTTSNSRQTVDGYTCYLCYLVIVTGMRTRVAIRTYTNYPERYGCSGRQLSVVARRTHKKIYIFCILCKRSKNTE